MVAPRRSQKPLWAQVLAVLILLLGASWLGFTYVAAQFTPPTTAGLAAVIVAPWLILAGAVVKWDGRPPRTPLLVISILTYVLVGIAARGYVHPPFPPILALLPLVYPIAGLIWGFLVWRAGDQGYLPSIRARTSD